jgi:phosphoglycerate kinase
VPVSENGTVLDDLRIKKTIPTIEFLRQLGAKIILVSHIEGKAAKLAGGVDTLEPVSIYINSTYAKEFGQVTFVKDFLNFDASNMNEGDVVLFENLRVDDGEKKNNIEFAKKLAAFADIYVNDAFAVSHRSHASVVALPSLLPHFAGVQLMEEIKNLSKVFNPERPFIFILGGAKFDTKLPLIKKFMEGKSAADFVFLGGALLNNILKEKGYEIGKSLVSEGDFNLQEVVNNPKLIIPSDVVVKGPNGVLIKQINEVSSEDVIMDVGPSMTLILEEKLKTAKFVLWNGPMGNYEDGFKDQTIKMAETVAKSNVPSALGGGDTTAAVAELGYESDTSKAPHMFVSTGGGAMIEYLLNESLPGIDALS